MESIVTMGKYRSLHFGDLANLKIIQNLEDVSSAILALSMLVSSGKRPTSSLRPLDLLFNVHLS